MANYFIVFALIIVFVFGMEFFRKHALDKLLKDLYQAAYVKKDEELFELLIFSPQAKMLMNNPTRYIMQLNNYIACENTEKVLKTIDKLKKLNMNTPDKLTFYGNAIGYLSEREHPAAISLLAFIKDKEKSSKSLQMEILLLDCEQVVDIYINKNANRIKELKLINMNMPLKKINMNTDNNILYN